LGVAWVGMGGGYWEGRWIMQRLHKSGDAVTHGDMP